MRIRLRSPNEVFAHSSCAARARPIAARTSSGPHFGTLPSGSPVKGCSICIGSLPALETTRAASASSCAGVMRLEGRETAAVSVAAGASVMVDMRSLSQVTPSLLPVRPEHQSRLSGHDSYLYTAGACDSHTQAPG